MFMKFITASTIVFSALLFLAIVVSLFTSRSFYDVIASVASFVLLISILAIFFWIRSVVNSRK